MCMQGAVNFALMMSQLERGCPVDYNVITDLFLQVWVSSSSYFSRSNKFPHRLLEHNLSSNVTFSKMLCFRPAAQHDQGGNRVSFGYSEA